MKDSLFQCTCVHCTVRKENNNFNVFYKGGNIKKYGEEENENR